LDFFRLPRQSGNFASGFDVSGVAVERSIHHQKHLASGPRPVFWTMPAVGPTDVTGEHGKKGDGG
jgi:hypothetical protein